MLKTLASACVLAVLAFTSTPAHAQTFDNRTYFTFDQPITLPGVTLPAGTYLFRNPDITSRRVVQVLSDDGKRSYAMLLTTPAQRTEASSQPEVRFMETAEGTPAAIKAWWYPGNPIGWEFIYPREQALKLAKAASSPVLTTAKAANDTTEEMKTADLARVSGSGSETAVTVEQTPAATTVAGTAQAGEIARGTMLPSGLVVIEGKTYDAVSEGMAIEAGQTVLVVAVSTQRLVVRPDNTIRAELAETAPTHAAGSSDPLAQEIADPFAE